MDDRITLLGEKLNRRPHTQALERRMDLAHSCGQGWKRICGGVLRIAQGNLAEVSEVVSLRYRGLEHN